MELQASSSFELTVEHRGYWCGLPPYLTRAQGPAGAANLSQQLAFVGGSPQFELAEGRTSAKTRSAAKKTFTRFCLECGSRYPQVEHEKTTAPMVLWRRNTLQINLGNLGKRYCRYRRFSLGFPQCPMAAAGATGPLAQVAAATRRSHGRGISACSLDVPRTRKVYGAEDRYRIGSKMSWMTLLNAPDGSCMATTQGVLP